jgi:hypothetical protein
MPVSGLCGSVWLPVQDLAWLIEGDVRCYAVDGLPTAAQDLPHWMDADRICRARMLIA